jgi:HEAT repeat protein
VIPIVDEATVSTDARATKPLARLLRDTDEEVRSNASSAFVHITVRDPGIVRDLERLLEDRSKAVRMNAAMALSASGTRRSLLALREAFNREAEPDVKAVYGQALRELEQRFR